MPRDVRLKIAEVCSMLGVEGLRGDLVTNRAASAMVALEGRTEVGLDDVDQVLLMCMNHRMRRDPLDPLDNSTKVNPGVTEKGVKLGAFKHATVKVR